MFRIGEEVHMRLTEDHRQMVVDLIVDSCDVEETTARKLLSDLAERGIVLGIEVKGPDLLWGTFGKNGDQPLEWVRIGDMSSDHLRACLKSEKHMSLRHKKAMGEELERRGEK